ncbi:hypothetical protein ACFQHO_32820 [Actinomadura yumaensis]|uniref:hypothetical protein n=1 Tax=Actinomadura yumaensis TaxID=111807 RepID=UPI003612F13F
MNRAALRIAWRDAARSKGRTALVVAMIGLPVMAVVAMAVLMRTSEWSAKESLPYEIGAADARFSGTGRGELQQGPYDDGGVLGDAPEGGRPWTTGEFQRLVAAEYGPGARVVPFGTGKVAAVRAGHADVPADVTELDLRDPLAAGVLRIERGGPRPVPARSRCPRRSRGGGSPSGRPYGWTGAGRRSASSASCATRAAPARTSRSAFPASSPVRAARRSGWSRPGARSRGRTSGGSTSWASACCPAPSSTTRRPRRGSRPECPAAVRRPGRPASSRWPSR